MVTDEPNFYIQKWRTAMNSYGPQLLIKSQQVIANDNYYLSSLSQDLNHWMLIKIEKGDHLWLQRATVSLSIEHICWFWTLNWRFRNPKQ